MAKKRTKAASNTRKTAAKSGTRRSTKVTTSKSKAKRTTASKPKTAARVDVDLVQLDSLRESYSEQAREVGAHLDRAAAAQRSVMDVYQELASLESRYASEQSESREELTRLNEEAQQMIRELSDRNDQAGRELVSVGASVRALVDGLSKLPDPLVPLTSEDDKKQVARLTERLGKHLSAKRDSPFESLLGIASVLEEAFELTDLVGQRIKVQSHRVELLRDNMAELEGDHEGLLAERANLVDTQHELEQRLAATEADLVASRDLVARLEEELREQEAKVAKLEAELTREQEQANANRTRLEEDLDTERSRSNELAGLLERRSEIANKAEGLAVELGEAIVNLADGHMEEAPLDLPNLRLVRDELHSLVSDAAEVVDDDDDELFREDLAQDITKAAQNVAAAILARRSRLIEEIIAQTAAVEELQAEVDSQGEQIEDQQDRLREAENELSRLNAQLETSLAEVAELSEELAGKNKEITDIRGSLAKTEAENEDLRVSAEEGKEAAAELKQVTVTLNALRKDSEKTATRNLQVAEAQNHLTSNLIDLAEAVDQAVAVSGVKSGAVDRFSKTLKRLESIKGDQGQVVRGSTDVVAKVTTRVNQLAQDLRRRVEVMGQQEKSLADLEKRYASTSDKLEKREAELKDLKAEAAELAKLAKKVPGLEQKLDARDALIAQQKDELGEQKQSLRQIRAEAEELKAREKEISSSLSAEIKELKSRLDRQSALQRQMEQSLTSDREDAEGQIATLRAENDELKRTLEEREDSLDELRADLDDAEELENKIRELQANVRTLTADLNEAHEQRRQLELQIDEQEATDALEEALEAAHRQRDDLINDRKKLERELAEERGVVASLRSSYESLKKKSSERQAQWRSDYEELQEKYDAMREDNRRKTNELAGANAKIRTLTDH